VYRQLDIGGSKAKPAMPKLNQAESESPIQLCYSTDIYGSRSPGFDKLSKFKQFSSILCCDITTLFTWFQYITYTGMV